MAREISIVKSCLLLAAISSPVFGEEWKATVTKSLKSLVSSCVVIPCSFSHPKETLPTSKLRGMWHLKSGRNQLIYFEDQTRVLENFKGRTRLLGRLGENNCTLEITEVKDHDNGPFCFRIELARTETDTSTRDKFSFVEDCVELNMLHDPPKPELRNPETAIEGRPFTIMCSVTHTCPSHVPKLSWSRGSGVEITEIHRELHVGNWEVQSVLTFTPEEKDDHTEITCTSQFNGGKTSSQTLKLYVKRHENYNHIIIPTVVAITITVIFSVFCILMVKRYKKRISELQSQDGSMWNRLSRLSRRIRSSGPPPQSCSNQRMGKGGRVDSNPMSNITNTNSCQNFSKPRFPSPKSKQKFHNNRQDDDADDYMNTTDLNVYGNI